MTCILFPKLRFLSKRIHLWCSLMLLFTSLTRPAGNMNVGAKCDSAPVELLRTPVLCFHSSEQSPSGTGTSPPHGAGPCPVLWNHNVVRYCINNLSDLKHFQLPSAALLSSFFVNVETALKVNTAAFHKECSTICLLWHDCCTLCWSVLQTAGSCRSATADGGGESHNLKFKSPSVYN